ncbi:MAG: alpha/beta hydrolase [Bacteroidetes bacterium]|nr:alpha/beta hydrolase [Bacteroidota bacterium]
MPLLQSYTPSQLCYETTGTGKAIVLVHGFGEDISVWQPIVAHLSAHYRLLLPHLRGSHLSPFPSDLTSSKPLVSMESMAADIHEMLEQENIDECVMLGHSMGGYITLAFAEKYPERLCGFGLIHSTSYADNETKKEARRKNAAFIGEQGSRSFLNIALPGLFGKAFQIKHPEIINELIDRASLIPPASLIAYLEAMRDRPDRTAILRNTKLPVFFCIGKEDIAVSPEDAMQQSKLPLNATTLILDEVGHQGMLETPEKLNEAIMEFLTR